jgi:predicted CopG family antitoxin
VATSVEKNQKKREGYLVRRLVDGLAGWLTFKQACGASSLYCEHFLYPPMYDIVSGRGWSVLAQEVITNSTPKNGPPRTLDFVFYEKPNKYGGLRGLIMIEVKYLRDDNVTQELCGLDEDFMKLRGVTPNNLRNAKALSACGTPGKWQLIVAQRDVYDKLSKAKSKKFSKVVEMLANASSQKTLSQVYRSVIETKLKSEFHWHVVAIGEKQWPSP